MPWHSVNTSIMIQSLRTRTPGVKQVWIAHDSARGGGGGGGQIMPLYNWYSHLNQEGKKYGYVVNGSKRWLIVKSEEVADETKRVFGDEVNITNEGQRELGASSDLKSSKMNIVGRRSLDGEENSKHYLR